MEYKDDVDNIMWDLLGSDSFSLDDFDDIIDIVTLTIYDII